MASVALGSLGVIDPRARERSPGTAAAPGGMSEAGESPAGVARVHPEMRTFVSIPEPRHHAGFRHGLLGEDGVAPARLGQHREWGSETPRPGYRVLLANGNVLIRAGLRSLLDEMAPAGMVAEAGSASETLLLLESRGFDLVLVSPFRGGDSERFLADLLDRAGDARVVVVSSDSDPAVIRSALAGGAAGYIPAETDPEVMIQAIRLALAGGIYVPPDALGLGPARDCAPPAEGSPAACPPLTGRQREVLARLLEGESNRQIAQAVGISTGSVKAHVASLLRIFAARNRTELVRIATARGVPVRRKGHPSER